MNQFIHVGFAFPGVPKVLDLEPIITSVCDDWIRYSMTNWILWTSRDAKAIYSEIHQHVDTNDQLLVIPIEPNFCAGRLSPWIWDWINSKRGPITKPFTLALPPPKA